MSTQSHTTTVAVVPAIAGTGLVVGAIALLLSDAVTTGHYTVNHLLQPLLVLGSVAAAVWVHRALVERKVITALLFLVVALVGSIAVAYGTLGRQAADRDVRVATAVAENRQLVNRNDDLEAARVTAKAECKSGAGPKCVNATARVDALVASMASLRQVSPDPRADAIADLLNLLFSFEKGFVRKVVAAIDPLILPLFLELGSIVFFAAAFPVRTVSTKELPNVSESDQVTVETEPRTFSRDQALADFRQLRSSDSQQFLSQRWNVSEGTVSKWFAIWEGAGAVDRQRNGKLKTVMAIEARPVERRRLGHMARVQ